MKLYYFELPGRAEAIRLLLTHAGIKFEDIRFKQEEWPKYKDKFDLKQLPALEVDGKIYTQSYAILEFLGSKYGYFPKCYEKIYRMMFVMNTCEDIFMKAILAVYPMSPLDAKGKEEALKKLLEVDGPLFLGAIQKKLEENESKDFIVGKKHTIADFYLLGFWANVLVVPEFNKAFYERIKTKYPVLFEYAEKRMKEFNPYYKKCQTKLYYFDIPGRGDMIRFLLKAIKMPFEDIKIKQDEWPKLKTSGTFELQQVPVLICEPCGVKICQSDAIMHRLSARYGFLPIKKPEKLYKVVWWCNAMKDLMENAGRFLFFSAIPEEKKKELRNDYFTKTVPVFFEAMENKLKANKCKCTLVGRDITMADFYLVGVMRQLVFGPFLPEYKDVLPKYPVLATYFEKMNAKLSA